MSTKTKVFLIILWVLLAAFVVAYLTMSLGRSDDNDASALVPVGISLPEPEKSSESSISSQESSESQSVSQSSQVSSASQSPVPTPPPSGFTQSQFDRIEMGMTYNEVVKVIGKEGVLSSEFEIGGIDSKSYQWKLSGEITDIYITFQDGKLQYKMASYSDSHAIKKATLAQYNQVETGMSFAEVTKIFGFDGSLISEISMGNHIIKDYVWRGTGGLSSATIAFTDGAVSSKLQYGLK